MGSPNSKMEGGDRAARLSTNSERSSFDSTSSQKVLIFNESGDERAPIELIELIEDHFAARTEKQQSQEGTVVQTQVFRSEDADGSVVTKTVRTTRMTTRSESGDFVTTIEVQTTTETETKDGIKSTSVATETSTETVAGQGATFMEEGSLEGDVQTQVFRTVEEDGTFVTKTVRTTRRTVLMNDVATTTIEVETTTETENKDGAKSTSVSTETRTEAGGNNSDHGIDLATEEKTSLLAANQDVTVDWAENEGGGRHPFLLRKQQKYHPRWRPQFVAYLDRRNKRIETLSATDLLQNAREFCRENLAEFRPELFDCGSMEANEECWEKVAQLADHYPIIAAQMLPQDFGDNNVLIVDELSYGFDSNNPLRKEVAVSMLRRSKTDACEVFDVLLVLKGGDVVYHGDGEEIVEYFHDLGYQCAPGQQVAQFLLSLAAEDEGCYRITVPTSSRLHGTFSHFIKNFAVLMKFADDTALIARGEATYARQPSIDIISCQDRYSPATDYHIATSSNVAAAVNVTEETDAAPDESVKTEVFRSEESDGSIVTKTVRTTSHTVKSDTGALVTTIEVETTTETESRDGTMSTTVATGSHEEMATEASSLTTTSTSTASATSAAAVNVTEQTGTATDESVKTEVFRSEESDGSIVTKTVRTTSHTVKSVTGELLTTIEVETTTETESRDGTMSTTMATGSHEETEETATSTTINSKVTSLSTKEAEETTTYTTVVPVPFTEKSEETTTVTTVTKVISAPSTEETEEVTTETTETTETSQVVCDVPSTQEMEECEETTTVTTVTKVISAPSTEETEEVTTETTETTETSQVVCDVPSTQEMEECEETTTVTTVTKVISALSSEETEETTIDLTEMEGSSPLMTSGIMASSIDASAESTFGSQVSSRMLFTVDPQGSIVTDAPKVGVTKKTMKKVKEIVKQEKDVLAVTAHSSHETRSARAAAAWGEEVRSYNAESAHMRFCIQVLMVRRWRSLRLAFDNITCAGQVTASSKEPTNVVKDVTGYAESGTLTAVVGAGRAGKSAFLTALAGEEDPTMGRIFYKGNEVSAVVRRRATGFCWFGDEHVAWHGTTTVREALCLSAYLRQGDDIPETRKLETIESCLELLGLTDLAGQYISSCSVVETRLVTIGVELAFAPSILLLDEPTSGLDVDSAQRIIRILEQVARTGRTVVCSIADSTPTTELRAFDRLLLLASGGETIFHGETRLMVQYLEALPGMKGLSGGKSVTAWAVESVGGRSTTTTRGCEARTNTKKKKHRRAGSRLSTSDVVNREKETRFVQLFQRSEIRKRLLTQMQRAGYLHPDSKEQHVPALITAYRSGNLRVQASSWRTQMTWLVRRVILSYWRSLSSILSVTTTLATTMQWQLLGVVGVLMMALMGFIWVRIATRSTEYDTFDGVNQGASLIAWSTLILGASFALGAIARSGHGNAWRENACWRREQAWQAYPAVAYHFCSSVVELAFVLGITLVAAMLTFTLFGFWSITESGNFALYWFTLAIFALGQVYLAQWLVRLVPSESIAAVAGAGVNLLPLLIFVWSWRSSAVSRLTSLLVSLTPQHYALQVLQALVFGAATDSCVYDVGSDQAERELPCRDLRLIPSDERYFIKKLTVSSYAEIEYGAERGSVALRLFVLGVFLAMFRFLAIVALKKRQARS